MYHRRIKGILPILLVFSMVLLPTGCQHRAGSGNDGTASAPDTAVQQQDSGTEQGASSPEETSPETQEDDSDSVAAAENHNPVNDDAPSKEGSDSSTGSSAASSGDSRGTALSGFTICLDPGHGITSQSRQEAVSPLSSEQKPAYVSGASGNSQTEEALNLAVAQLVKSRLENRGATVVMTRTTHEAAVSNIERATIANEAGADLCIRIHADGAENTAVHGFSILVPSGSLLGTPSIVTPSRAAAQCIEDALKQSIDAQDRGLTERSDMTGFNWSEVPVVLVEMGFLTNPEEDRKLAAEEYRNGIADGIATGTENWLLNKLS